MKVVTIKPSKRSFKSRWYGKPVTFAGMYTVAGFDVAKNATTSGLHQVDSAWIRAKGAFYAHMRRHPYQHQIFQLFAEFFAVILAVMLAMIAVFAILGVLGAVL